MMIDKKAKELLDSIASKSPTPGGGSVAAMAGAISCALSEMVCNLTIGKKKYADREEAMKKFAEEARKLREEFEILMDEDSKAFDEVMKAFKEGGEKQTAFKRAADVPMATAEKAWRAMEIAYNVAINGNKNAISDAGCAAYMAYSSFKSAVMNVRINLPYIDDESYTKMAQEKIEKMDGKIEELLRKTTDFIQSILNEQLP